jgi:phenylpropionate dioxygenase-like ring-hydroxylating dioxygenase large terminal subunit
MNLRWWVPVASVEALRAATPLAARAFGEDLVLWRAADGAAATAFADRCPHRGASLARGRITAAGELECAYHGWRFAASGRCVAIPALPAFQPPATHRACAWLAAEAHGLIWVASAGAPKTAPQSALQSAHHSAPEVQDLLAGLPARRILCGPFDVATSAPRVVENFLDTAHFGLVHEGFLGSRDEPTVPNYRVEHDEHGRPWVPQYRAWQPRASSAATGGAWVDYSYRLLSPFAALLTKKAEGQAPAEAYALWCCPLDEESTRVWFTICTDAPAAQLGDAALREFQTTIFSQDAPVLESQRPRRLPITAASAGDELHCAADRLSVAYRRWLVGVGVQFGTC